MAILRLFCLPFFLLLSSCSFLSENTEQRAPYEATVDKTANSPSGKYRLSIVSGHDGEARYKTFQIFANDQSAIPKEKDRFTQPVTTDFNRLVTLYTPPDRFPSRFRNYFQWDSQDRVWIYDGDTGCYFWESNSTGQWEGQKYLLSKNYKTLKLPSLLIGKCNY
jgi:hypothetical protein